MRACALIAGILKFVMCPYCLFIAAFSPTDHYAV